MNYNTVNKIRRRKPLKVESEGVWDDIMSNDNDSKIIDIGIILTSYCMYFYIIIHLVRILKRFKIMLDL